MTDVLELSTFCLLLQHRNFNVCIIFIFFWNEQTCKPSSVENNYLSWLSVTKSAQCHLLEKHRADAKKSLCGVAPDRVCRAM